MSDPDLARFWSRLGHPSKGCSVCKVEFNADDESKVLWRCQVCGRLVCRACTLTLPRLVKKTERGYMDSMRGPFGSRRAHPPRLLSPIEAEALAIIDDEEFGESVAALRGGDEYLTQTLCSRDCWETAGRPDE